mmetsp:Transcript_9015/g.11815  ORF Transcript_9015/g.11815 Transcript_9015/m.11815 type:complete len:468 (+) Transcript_9015:24-1427(+)
MANMKRATKKKGSFCGVSVIAPILLVVTLTPVIFNFHIGFPFNNSPVIEPENNLLAETEALLSSRLDKLSEQQLLVEKLFQEIEDAHRKEADIKRSQDSPKYQEAPSSISIKVGNRPDSKEEQSSSNDQQSSPSNNRVKRKVWKSVQHDIFEAPPVASNSKSNALACSMNNSIKVDRNAAERSGLYWYDRSSPRCALTDSSHKMEPGCSGVGNERVKAKQRQILVVGVQRSGTHFTWEMFNRLGVHVHHEGLGPDGSVSWLFAYKANSYAINNPEPLSTHKFCFVFHQVRHPMRVVSSIVKASRKAWDPYWDFIARVDPKVCGSVQNCKSQPLLLRSARQWLVWNQHIELYADVRFRVEDTSPRVVCRLAMFSPRICESDGRYHTTSSKVIQPIVEPQAPQDGHTGVDHLVATWDKIAELDTSLVSEMQAMTKRYGYSLDPADHPQSLSTEAFRAGGIEKKKKRMLR